MKKFAHLSVLQNHRRLKQVITRDFVSMLSTSNLIGYVWSITRRKKLAVAVFFLSLLTVVLDALGLALLYPLFDSVVGGNAELEGPWGYLRDLAQKMTGSAAVKGYLTLLLVIFFIKSVLLVVKTGAETYLITKLQQDWILEIYDHYLHSPYRDVATETRGTTMQNIFGIPRNLAAGIVLFISIISSIIFCIALLMTLFSLNFKATLTIILVFSVIFFIVKSYIFDFISSKTKKSIKINKQLKSIAIESILSLVAIRLYGVERAYIQRLLHRLNKILRIEVLLAVASSIPSNFAEFIIVALVAGAFFMFHVLFGLSFQEAAPLIGAFVIISTRAYTRLNAVLKYRIKLEALLPWFADAHKLLSKPTVLQDLDLGIRLSEIKEDIVLKNVSFNHSSGKSVLKNLSLVFPHGQMVGIAGPSGVGKTTLSHLLTRLYEPDDGKILIGNTDIREFTLRSLRRRIGYVPQDPVILNGTISENIRLGEPDATAKEVIDAAKLAGAHDFVMSLSKGYETMTGEQGNRLSGGERQRIAIARALLRKPDVLIIDEGTSALDPRAAEKVRRTIERLARKATVIVIAHRLEILKNADTIFEFMPGGEIVTRTFNQITKAIETVT